MADRPGEERRVAAARAAAEADAAELAAIARELWTVAADPLGDLLLLPLRAAVDAGDVPEDPLSIDAIPWVPVVARFTARHGRPPAPGARTHAGRLLRGEPRGP